jgi:hypothetical protein
MHRGWADQGGGCEAVEVEVGQHGCGGFHRKQPDNVHTRRHGKTSPSKERESDRDRQRERETQRETERDREREMG